MVGVRIVRRLLPFAAAVLVGIQLVPYGWKHSNPRVVQDAPWPSAEARAIAVKACYDCHSNETDWPAYSYVAPMSWLVRYDVDRGREELNFSLWGAADNDADDGAETVEDGSMPPRQYRVVHRDANLSDEEKRILIDALEAMDDSGGGRNRGPGGGDDSD